MKSPVFFRFRERWQRLIERTNRRLEFWLTNPRNYERNHRLRVVRDDDEEM